MKAPAAAASEQRESSRASGGGAPRTREKGALLSEIRRAGLAALAGLLMSGCGDSGPTKVPSDPPTISCPANQTTTSVLGAAVPVNFPAPTVVGGATPVTTSCTPASGASLPVGNHPVTCTARDAQQRTSLCSFAAAVVRAPTLTATKFMAFGDSITGGVLSLECGLSRPQCSTLPSAPADPALRAASLLEDLRLLRTTVTHSAAAYPNQLTTLLTARYTAQSVTMANEGLGGEEVTTSETLGRFRAALDALRPEVVLLQEGVNDLHRYGVSAVPEIAKALRLMVIEARARGMRVYVGTLLPERECACRAFAPSLIVPANDQIRAMAFSEGALLVDLYQAFGGQTSTLLGIDGLHPNEAGYQRMASTFFDAIQATLE